MSDWELLERAPTSPGKALRVLVLEGAGITQGEFAEALGISRLSANQLMTEKRTITAEMALRIERFTGLEASTWLEMQNERDLWLARKKLGKSLNQIKPMKQIAAKK